MPLHTHPPRSHQSFLVPKFRRDISPLSYFHSPQHIVSRLFACMTPHSSGFLPTSLAIPSGCLLQADPLLSDPWYFSCLGFLVSIILSSIFYPSVIPLIPRVTLITIHMPQISISILNCSSLLQTYISNFFLNIST